MNDSKLWNIGSRNRERRGLKYVPHGWSFLLFLALFGVFLNSVSMLQAQNGIGKEYFQFLESNGIWRIGGAVAFVSIIACCVLISYVRMQTIIAWAKSSRWKKYALLFPLVYSVGFILLSVIVFSIKN